MSATAPDSFHGMLVLVGGALCDGAEDRADEPRDADRIEATKPYLREGMGGVRKIGPSYRAGEAVSRVGGVLGVIFIYLVRNSQIFVVVLQY